MKVFIAVVSHLHSELINEIDCLNSLHSKFTVVVKSNKEGDDFDNMKFLWLNSDFSLGFGENNNFIFNYCRSNLGMKDDDYFIVLNPDVDIKTDQIEKLILLMLERNNSIAAVNLYKDKTKLIYDDSVRHFPKLKDFVSSFILKKNNTIVDKSIVVEPSIIDWAAGSFLAFKSGHYRELCGFDEGYFMYCEDIDICFRSYKKNQPVIYFPSVEGIHLAKHANRKIMSKHFYWHVSSIIRFLFSKRGLTKPKSSVR
ncbi:glycosyltransferase family 2 protein [Vibrio tasmaniensis]|uniref:glycosyltransferase family 2 protein n=1 Tax=Vibrio tasmaniensis TaxID=212663 RepID=UPI00107FBA01|nr:glycosyltransferase family 2 protein [Vibrio tasmaniensis]